MLLYNNSSYWRIVFQFRGSLVFQRRNILSGVLVALATFVISYLKHMSSPYLTEIAPVNNVGWNMMGGTIVFAVVFRTNLGWQRYWEAVSQLQLMYSKWADAFMQCVGFVNVTLLQLEQSNKHDTDENILFLRNKLGSLQKNFSLLSALAAHRLTHGDVHRMKMRCAVAEWSDQIILRRELRTSEDLTGATTLPGLVKVTERSQLTQNLDNSWFGDYCVTEVPTQDEIKMLVDTGDRVHAVMYWVIHDLSELSPKLSTAPPIQSRMYQELSNGMLGFQNAIKVADVPFPFQFTQLFNVLVIAFTIFIPIYASTFTESLLLSPLIAYVVHQSILVINQVAMQLESPFGCEDVNSISVKDFHARFLESIIEINPISKIKIAESKQELDAIAASREVDVQNPTRNNSRRPSYALVECLANDAPAPRQDARRPSLSLIETLGKLRRPSLMESLTRPSSPARSRSRNNSFVAPDAPTPSGPKRLDSGLDSQAESDSESSSKSQSSLHEEERHQSIDSLEMGSWTALPNQYEAPTLHVVRASQVQNVQRIESVDVEDEGPLANVLPLASEPELLDNVALSVVPTSDDDLLGRRREELLEKTSSQSIG